jgi:hypothetical protein
VRAGRGLRVGFFESCVRTVVVGRAFVGIGWVGIGRVGIGWVDIGSVDIGSVGIGCHRAAQPGRRGGHGVALLPRASQRPVHLQPPGYRRARSRGVEYPERAGQRPFGL